MTIKTQIEALIEEMKSRFYQETGIPLIALPDTSIKKIPLDELKTLSDKFFGLDILRKTRIEEVVAARGMFMCAAKEMGYAPTTIARVVNRDRSSIMLAQNNKRQYDIEWQKTYSRYKKYLMDEIK